MTQVDYAKGPRPCQDYESTVNPTDAKYFRNPSVSNATVQVFQFGCKQRHSPADEKSRSS